MKNDKMYDLMTAVCRSRLQKCCGPKKLHLKVTESYSFLLFTHTIITVKSKYPQLTCYKFIYNNKKKANVNPIGAIIIPNYSNSPICKLLKLLFQHPIIKEVQNLYII